MTTPHSHPPNRSVQRIMSHDPIEAQQPSSSVISQDTIEAQQPSSSVISQDTIEAQQPSSSVISQDTIEAQQPSSSVISQDTIEAQQPSSVMTPSRYHLRHFTYWHRPLLLPPFCTRDPCTSFLTTTHRNIQLPQLRSRPRVLLD